MKPQNVLVIGSGGREQALAWKLAQSPRIAKVFVAPGNGGSAGAIENVAIGFTDGPALLKFAQGHDVALTVVGQEAASEAGVVDLFEDAGLPIFGPNRAAARIEFSKVFSKDLMRARHIPTAQYKTFTDPAHALTYAKSRPLPVVVKADGLAVGKGVTVAATYEEAAAAIEEVMVKRVFGDSGNQVVIEDFLRGQEVSIHALSDGKRSVIFPVSQDHKQIFDSDLGPNTGGMGVVAPIAWVTPQHLKMVDERVVTPALEGLAKQKSPLKGMLYPGLMIDGASIQTLEFNARFGDPEAQTYIRLFDGDLFEVLLACAQGRLDPNSVTWKPGFAACVCVASQGYPGDYRKGGVITGLDEAAAQPGVVVFHAGTKRDEDGTFRTAGGRVLGVTATGATLWEALDKTYAAIKLIHFDGMHYRTDIGRRPS